MNLQQPDDSGSTEIGDDMPPTSDRQTKVSPKLNATRAIRALMRMQNQITILKDTISKLTQQKLETSAEVQRLNDMLAPLQQDAIENAQRISGLELAIGDLKAKMAFIDTQLKDLTAKVTALESRYQSKFTDTQTRFAQ